MARVARHKLAERCLRPGTLYHVTNRGAARRELFRTPHDRLIFLAALADACCRYGLVVHAFCLMSNHIHLLVEDARGCLSQAMSLAQSVYARYLNDARGERGAGHVFGDRFFCEVVATPDYYDQLASYILLNPLRCARPLAASAEHYAWSSAALHCSSLRPGAYLARLLDEHAGAEALLAAMPRPSTPEVARHRRARIEALVEGAWLSADAARCGRSADQMRAVLAQRAGIARPTPDAQLEVAKACARVSRDTSAGGLPVATAPFAGARLAPTLTTLRDECGVGVPGGEAVRSKVLCYTIWRFCSASRTQIAAVLEQGVDAIARAIASVRTLRATEPAWEAALWRLEWRLRWLLACGPFRA